jgi:mono/diheme cytochrome c family protein
VDNLQSRAGRGLLLAGMAAVLVGAFGNYSLANDNDRDNDNDDSRVRIGFAIAPVPLSLRGKNRALVGLGSYIVNGVGDCNGCHSAGPQTEFAPGGNPYFKGNPPEVINQATYLGGGRDFGSLIPGTPTIVSRNLTPDRTGRAVGGDSFEEFRSTIRTGMDPDHLHPNCAGPSTATCYGTNQPFNGDLLQVMPWVIYRNMTDRDLRAIYEYLSAIPCNSGPATGPLHHDCS